MSQWSILDTGIRTAAENTTLDDVILKCRNRNQIPNTIRFLQYKPNAVLVGFHQSVEQEARIEYCKKNNIDINRRITGGGTIYFDEPQIGWEVIANRNNRLIPKNIDGLYEKICNCTVRGLRKLGVNASFRPKNDIEVNGHVLVQRGGYSLKTEQLHYDHEDRIMSSPVPVEIHAEFAFLTADSMLFDLNTHQTVLKGNVDGVFARPLLL